MTEFYEPAPTTTTETPHRLRLLLVDDQPVARAGLAALVALSPELQLVGQAEDGVQAVELAVERAPDVILMDIEMPLMDGLEATRQIRALGLPVHIIISSIHTDYAAQAREAGADSFVGKDESPERLLRELKQLGELKQSSELPDTIKREITGGPNAEPQKALERSDPERTDSDSAVGSV